MSTFDISVLDKEGDTANVHDGALIMIDYVHEKIHEGVFFDAQHVFATVANNGKVYLRFKTTTKEAHLTIALSVDGNTLFKSYIGTTYTADGTEITAFNRLIDSGSEETPTVEVYHTPTIDTLGTSRFNQFIPGGSGPLSTGITGSDRIETIISAGKDILIELTNVSGVSQDYIGIVAEWYETD